MKHAIPLDRYSQLLILQEKINLALKEIYEAGPAVNIEAPSGAQWPSICAIVTIVMLGLGGPVRAQECSWDPIFSSENAPGNVVYAMAVYDDGSGPSLFVGGEFSTVAGVDRTYIARWDGQSWHDVGGGMGGQVWSLAVHDDGSGSALYAGGDFQIAGGVPAVRVARWDGTKWTAVGDGANARVFALASHDDGNGSRLYAGGEFTQMDGSEALHVAAWDGDSWSPVGGGTSGVVLSLGSVNNTFTQRLWMGGFFETAGDTTVHNIAAWNGAEWLSLHPAGTNGPVRTITDFNDGSGTAPFIGGTFPLANVIVFNVAKYKFLQFLALDDGVNGDVRALAKFDDGRGEALFVGGDFTETGGAAADKIARWDGDAWEPVGGGLRTGEVFALASFGEGPARSLYAGGSFRWAGGFEQESLFMARWLCPDVLLFADDFESGNTSAWN